jgi:hypothetical protein
MIEGKLKILLSNFTASSNYPASNLAYLHRTRMAEDCEVADPILRNMKEYDALDAEVHLIPQVITGSA